MKMFDVLVIGGGIAGLTAAREAAHRGCATGLVEAQPMFGGQIANVDQVDGYPEQEAVSGMLLGMDCAEQCRALGVKFVNGEVKALAMEGSLCVASASGATLQARAVVVASGARLKMLGVPGETALVGRGVSQCASCDGPLFHGQDVAVVGGGDAAAQEALVLVEGCRTVTLICRSRLRAKRHYAEKLMACAKVTVLEGTVVDEIVGKDGVEGLRLRGAEDGSCRDLPCHGVFPFVGSMPNSGFLPDAIRRAGGYVLTDKTLMSSVPGIFAAGAVRQGYGGQLADALDEGGRAARAAAGFLRDSSLSKETVV